MESRGALWEWFEPRRRAYPWRGTNDPYLVLVSEVMLQQTQASRVAPAFERFVARFPSVTALARAGRDEVLRAWGSLGYNRRAVALSEAARAIVRDHGGMVPREPSDLARLRGVGPYTAAAVASIGHGLPVAAIDTNVRRVVARARLGCEPGEAPAGELKRAADAWLDRDDPGGWNQALMDLGRTVCRPTPRCPECPLRQDCAFQAGRRGRGRRTHAGRPHGRFEGSSRQVRGAVVRVLRDRPAVTVRELSAGTSRRLDEVVTALRALAADGVVDATPAALAGRPAGRVRLAAG